MKLFVVLSCMALAVAKPQGYSYNQPSSSGFGLSAQAGAPSFAGSAGSQYQGGASLPAPQTFSAGPSFSAGASLSAPQTFSAGPSFSAGASLSAAQTFSAGPSFSAGASLPAPQTFSAGPSFSAGASLPATLASSGPSFNAPEQSAAPAAQPQDQVVVHKNIYVHVPPPGFDDQEPSSAGAPAQAQKHYKIIFIKAPSGPAIDEDLLKKLAKPQSEEKTIVYVLAKKPESIDDLLAKAAKSGQEVTPTKPEVYFIKYKTQKEQPQDDGPYPAAAAPAAPETASVDTESNAISAADEPVAQSYAAPASSSAQSYVPPAPQPQSQYLPAQHAPASVYGAAH